jgi:hypothetical protein
MKLSNTRDHALVGFLCGFWAAIAALNLPYLPAKGWAVLAALAFFAGTCLWEWYQYCRYGEKPLYWQFRGVDTIVDILIANALFNLPLWVLVIGTYAGNVLRP